MKTLFAIAVGSALAALLFAPVTGCAATSTVVGPSCAAITVANDVCDIVVPVLGADGKTTYVHIPASELRDSAAARLTPAVSR